MRYTFLYNERGDDKMKKYNSVLVVGLVFVIIFGLFLLPKTKVLANTNQKQKIENSIKPLADPEPPKDGDKPKRPPPPPPRKDPPKDGKRPPPPPPKDGDKRPEPPKDPPKRPEPPERPIPPKTPPPPPEKPPGDRPPGEKPPPPPPPPKR